MGALDTIRWQLLMAIIQVIPEAYLPLVFLSKTFKEVRARRFRGMTIDAADLWCVYDYQYWRALYRREPINNEAKSLLAQDAGISNKTCL